MSWAVSGFKRAFLSIWGSDLVLFNIVILAKILFFCVWGSDLVRVGFQLSYVGF
jgi:hypothetical protein